MIELLKHIFKGPLASYGGGVKCDDRHTPGTILLADLFANPKFVQELLHRHAFQLNTSDLRPVASAWMLKYTILLLPPVIAAATLLKQVLPLDIKDVSIDLDCHGCPRKIFVPHQGYCAVNQDTSSRYTSLIYAHLTPLVDVLSDISNLPAKILWGNIARRLDEIFEQAINLSPTVDLIVDIHTDRYFLLDQQIWPQGQYNPLFSQQKAGQVKQHDGQLKYIPLHRHCCLMHLLPEKERCKACPLSPCF